ncbi:hypothetical protein ILYODFUR_037533 [Ilyodon furcidens]|uniref:Uncharacterized protein n=1 Tax=Ilyodon furcidens TaxID=33524 RepID=A0ABV0SSI5_9TELE
MLYNIVVFNIGKLDLNVVANENTWVVKFKKIKSKNLSLEMPDTYCWKFSTSKKYFSPILLQSDYKFYYPTRVIPGVDFCLEKLIWYWLIEWKRRDKRGIYPGSWKLFLHSKHN